MMSIDDVDTRRENILRLVCKSASTDYNSDSLQGPDNYPEHRITFLERLKQFEQPPLPVDEKPPFFPHWINPGYNTDVSITYKKRGTEITDLRINYIDNNDGNNNDIDSVSPGSQTESGKSIIREEPRDLGNQVSTLDERRKRGGLLYYENVNINLFTNREEASFSDTTTAPYLQGVNPSGTSDERAKLLMDRRSRSTMSIRQFQSLEIIKERSSSMLSKTIADSEGSRIVNFPRKNQNILTNYLTPGRAIICRPIVRKPIELKKYDHIVTNVMSHKKK